MGNHCIECKYCGEDLRASHRNSCGDDFLVDCYFHRPGVDYSLRDGKQASAMKTVKKVSSKDKDDSLPESVKVLQECIDLQLKKSRDYQNPASTIKQADYYPNGIVTILDIIHAKTLRMRSVVEAMLRDPDYLPNFESLEDSAKDSINYYSFIISYCRGKMMGQDPDKDVFGRHK